MASRRIDGGARSSIGRSAGGSTLRWLRANVPAIGFHTLEPEVAGGLGPRTVADTSVHPPVVSRLHYEFAGWLGDPLLESFPCYVITADVAELVRGVGLTGFEIEAVEVSTTPEFEELHPAVELPLFVWLRVNGTAGTDDFAMSDDHCLVVSDRALQLLRDARLEHCDVEPWTRA